MDAPSEIDDAVLFAAQLEEDGGEFTITGSALFDPLRIFTEGRFPARCVAAIEEYIRQKVGGR